MVLVHLTPSEWVRGLALVMLVLAVLISEELQPLEGSGALVVACSPARMDLWALQLVSKLER